jgi:hypothetical protein
MDPVIELSNRISGVVVATARELEGFETFENVVTGESELERLSG